MPYKVYLADDSITIQKVVELTLSEEDFEVTAFGDGESALEAVRRQPPDIVLADIVMPRMDGYQLSAAIKKDAALKEIPVLLLAGTFENFDGSLAAASFADGHIIKPFESSELINKVKELVEMRAAQFLEAEPVDEGLFAEEILDAAPVDDLWSVVDMRDEGQPLADATEVISEDELWARAKLVSEPDRPSPFAPPPVEEDEGLPWDELPAEAVFEDEDQPIEAFLADEDDAVFLAEEAEEMPDESEVAEAEELEAVEYVDEAEPPAPTAPVMPSVPLPSGDEFHGLVEAKVREAISKMSADTVEKVVWDVVPAIVEKIVWEVVPGLAEEIIRKEIEKIKAGT